MKTVIIDDEINSRELLEEMLTNYIEDVEVVGTGEDVASGTAIIKAVEPEIVLLDIEMPGGDGFKLLDAFDVIPFKVIFITGFQEYALRAIKYSALDYILKPVNLEELRLAIEKVKKQNYNLTKNFELLKAFQLQERNATPSIVIPGVSKQHFIAINEIIAVVIENGNTQVLMDSGKSISSTSPLSHFENTFQGDLFMRIHKRVLINLKSVSTIDNGRTGFVHLKNGISLPFSSRKKPELNKRLKNNF